jgi:hypothetical protein
MFLSDLEENVTSSAPCIFRMGKKVSVEKRVSFFFRTRQVIREAKGDSITKPFLK